MMALIVPITMSLLTWAYESDAFKGHHGDNNNFDFQVGDYFNDLSQESQSLLNTSKHYDKNNSTFYADRVAPNTDNCFTYGPNCKPDYIHHIFSVPMQDHPGYSYEVVFSYNWRVLSIKNNFSHF